MEFELCCYTDITDFISNSTVTVLLLIHIQAALDSYNCSMNVPLVFLIASGAQDPTYKLFYE